MKEIKLTPYKIQLVQPLTKLNMEKRFCFAQEMLDAIQNKTISIDKTWFSNEAYFQLGGYVNEQNYRFWGKQRPYDTFTFEYIDKVLKYKDQGHSFSSVQHMFRRVKHDKYITRFRKYHACMGTSQEKYAKVSRKCWKRFKDARDNLVTIHDRDLKRWAIEEAKQLALTDFFASHEWLFEFKKKNKIVSRKITKFFTSKQQRKLEEIENEGAVFLHEFVENILPHHDHSQIISTDQSGYQYEMHGNRTLSFVDEDDTQDLARSSFSLTHSYTIQPMISMEGKILSQLMIVLKEPPGSFGPRVQQNLPRIPGIFTTCSRSGKVDKKLLRDWATTCLSGVVEKACLIVDSFSSHRARDIFDIENKEITIKMLPEGATSFMQPLDVYCFRQWKDIAKRFCERVIMDQFPSF